MVLCAPLGAAEQPVVPSTGLEVDTSVRNEVVAFWNRYYLASEGFEDRLGWTGSYGGTCDPGGTAAGFHVDVERRINFYRAMAGLEASVVVNAGATVVSAAGDPHTPPPSTTRETAAQNAALMFSYAGGITHNPPPTSPYACWTSAAWNAADRSNLALGLHGPDAIDGYIRENDTLTLSSWSPSVGHRRWIFLQGATEFASGDVPGYAGNFQSANVLYVIQDSSELEAVPPRFVAWPSAGYFPDEIVPTQWSLSAPGADFSAATVEMSDAAGAPIATTVIDRTTLNQGEPTIVWQVPAEVAATSVDEDTTYSVTVSGIDLAGQAVAHSYSVIVMDPDRVHVTPELAGTSQPPASGANYHFNPVESAEGYRFVVTRSEAADWTEGGEDGGHIIDATHISYSLRGANVFSSIPFRNSGDSSFRLAFPTLLDDDPQSFTIDRELVSSAGAQVRYHARRGFMQPNSHLRVMVSADGSNWVEIDSLAGGPGNSFDDPGFVLRSADVPADIGPYRIRFVLDHAPGSAINTIDQGASYAIGVFIDDISVTNSEWVTSKVETSSSPGNARWRLDDLTAGESLAEGARYGLRVVAELGGRDYPGEELKLVTVGSPLGGYDLWADADHPLLAGGFDDDDDGDGIANGIEYAFSTDPLVATPAAAPVLDPATGEMRFEQILGALRPELDYAVEWSDDMVTWHDTGSSVSHADGMLEGRVPLDGDSRFMRWNITRP